MNKVYYGKTNGVDYLAILNDEGTKANLFDDCDMNKTYNKSFRDLSDQELIEFMEECEFEDGRIEGIIDFNIYEELGNNEKERYYSIDEIKQGLLPR